MTTRTIGTYNNNIINNIIYIKFRSGHVRSGSCSSSCGFIIQPVVDYFSEFSRQDTRAPFVLVLSIASGEPPGQIPR